MIKNVIQITVILVSVLSFSACEKVEMDAEEPRDIYYIQFDNEDHYFKDTVVEYDFNGDAINELQIDLHWQVDSSEFDVTVSTDIFMKIINSQSIHTCWAEHKDFSDNTLIPFEAGDSIKSTAIFDERGTSILSGGVKHSFNQRSDYNWMEEAKATKVYWALSLAVGNKVHFGWAKVSCNLIDEVGLNKTPYQPIVIGEKE